MSDSAAPLMRAAVVDGPSALPSVREIPRPTPGDGEVALEILAAALNPLDQVVAAGVRVSPPYPYVTGTEAVGRLADGTRVYADPLLPPNGAMAAHSVAPADRLIELPDGINDADALCIGIAGKTAWLGLTAKGRLAPGENVLVTAATGAVGQIAVQGAKLLGAARVVAAGRNRAMLETLLERGADEIVVIDDDYAANLKAAAGDGFDLVLDGLFGPLLPPAVAATRYGGRVVNFGMRAGRTLEISGVALKGRDLLNLVADGFSLETIRDAYLALVDHVIAGRLHVAADILPLDDIAIGWKRQADSPNTKLIFVP